MAAHGGIDKVILLRQPDGLEAGGQVTAHVHNPADAVALHRCQHLSLVLLEPAGIIVGVGIKKPGFLHKRLLFITL
jgi:hypothetical protein